MACHVRIKELFSKLSYMCKDNAASVSTHCCITHLLKITQCTLSHQTNIYIYTDINIDCLLTSACRFHIILEK